MTGTSGYKARVNGGSTENFVYDNDGLLTGAGSLTLTRAARG